ncbi:MarR family winged helix-turn-helix transcriptional regulator [Neobacillus sp. LXY-1]|uniref:MarR family winged helix-turn-helix transcriptional regulator n=1 Tax=Neobacillus sp. LXY-1 TaxID=3379133 RepID=UPI003EDF0929
MNNIGYLIMKVSKELRYTLTKELAIYDLTASQWAVLKRLEMLEGDTSSIHLRTAVEIASMLDFDKPTMSGIVNRLCEKGMMVKEKHPNDKRSSILFLTSKAKELIPKLEMVSNGVMEDSLKRFSIEERDVFLQLLTKLDRTFTGE